MKQEHHATRCGSRWTRTGTKRGFAASVTLVCVVSWGLPATAGSPQTWDFESKLDGWSEPGGGSGVVADPDDPANHVYKIIATRPHHTRLVFGPSRRSPNFLATCRFRVLKRQGEGVSVYLYGRSTGGRFRGLTIDKTQARGFCWRGRDKANPSFGRVGGPARAMDGAWVHATLACYGDHLFAKVWAAGSPEPPWQIAGQAPDPQAGAFAIGVWTSPQTPCQAEVLIDDVTFRPLTEADLAGLRLRVRPRQRLDPKIAPPGRGAFKTPAAVGVATETTIVAFDPETGELAHVVHRRTGRDSIFPSVFRPLFDLRLTQPDAGKAQETSSAAFRTVAAQTTNDGGVRLSFADHTSLPLSAEVTAGPCDDSIVRLRLTVRNRSDWAIASIGFPQAAWPGRLGEDGADDRLILPWLGGSILPNPGEWSQSRSALYPGLAFAQFTALYDKTAGVYLAAHDPDGHCKRWDFRTRREALVVMDLVHLRPEVPAKEVTIPYDVVLGTFTGDWRDAADIYKRWARRQPWCRKTLAERDEVPQFLKRGAGVLITGIQNEAGYTEKMGRDLERLPELVASYRQRTELASVIFVPYGWENRGTWAGINYLPAVPSNDAWKRANAALRAQGDRTAFMTSGLWWVVKRQQTRSGPAFDDTTDFERRKEMVIHKADGGVWQQDNYDKTKTFGSWRGLSVKLCHGSAAARDTMRRTFVDIARLGTALISFDQEIGGGQHVGCYASAHGHPPGFGRWMWTDFRDLCQQILEEGKPIQPELGLFLENTSELAIPWMATYWSRQFGEVDHGAIGARGIGLFSYLYHEYVTAIGAACVQGQGARGTRPSASLRCKVLANNLTRGLIPGPFLHDVPLETDDPWRSQVARAYFSFCRPYARFPEYLVLGATRRPPKIACADTDAWFYRHSAKGQPLRPGGRKVVKVAVKLPAVTAGSFAAADGSVGTVIVNATDVPQTATLTLGTPAETAVLYGADRREIRKWGRLPAGHQIAVSLEPFGTRMLVTR